MLKKEQCIKSINKFREKTGIMDASDENIISTIHIMNFHKLDLHAALDQSSRGSNDHGIDAWYYSDDKHELFIYQSKLSENKGLVLRGLNDLQLAASFLEKIIVEGALDKVPNDNHAIYGLYIKLSNKRQSIKKIHFSLISLFDENELEDESAYGEFQSSLIKTQLNNYISITQEGKITTNLDQYCLEVALPSNTKTYELSKFVDATIKLRAKSALHLSYVSLYSLVELYRQRGDLLFDKNVRLSLINQKEAKDRLLHPLEETLDAITEGKINSNIFPFYHIGVTISATSSNNNEQGVFSLEAPSVINGCQTITISNHYLKKLEREADNEKRQKKIDIFKNIQVICKVVEGVSDEELKEITNANNRQNPIENWQLFSNEPLQIAIEIALKNAGVFYERQKGKFDSLMKNADFAKHYVNTNGAKIQIMELAQIIALGKKDLQKAAKPSEIFINKRNHDLIFDKSIPNHVNDIILGCNLFKCIKNGLNKYLNLPSHAANDYTQQIFKKPIVRNNVYYLAFIYYYQNKNKWKIRHDYSHTLLKIASPTLSEDTHSFYLRIVSKVREWYLDESKNLTIEPSAKKMEAKFGGFFSDLGLDTDGPLPFSKNAVDWSEYYE
jgi:hypothetical protein